MVQMKHFIDPNGDKIFQETMNTAEPIAEAINDRDLSALESHYLHFAKLLFDLLPHITDKKLSKLVVDAANTCVSLSKRLANGGSLNDIADFEKQQLNKFSLALS